MGREQLVTSLKCAMKRIVGIRVAACGMRDFFRTANPHTATKPLFGQAAYSNALWFAVFLIAWTLTACDSATKLDYGDQTGRFVSIAALKSLCRGTSSSLTQELKIEGIVTANDMRGEFPKTLVLEDASGGIEIAVDRTALANLFPLGAKVTVYCSGLTLGNYGGKVQLGARPTGDYSVDRIAGTELDRYIRCTMLNSGTRRPRTVRFDDLGAEDADTYVRFEGVRFRDAGEPWCDRNPETGSLQTSVRTLEDGSGGEFPVRILPSSHYAAEPVPQGSGSVNGIVDYFKGELSLRIVNYEIDFVISEALPTTCLSTAGCSTLRPTR